MVAITASTLLCFERRYLVKIPEVSLKLYRNIATMMASRLRDTSARVILAKAASLGDFAEDGFASLAMPQSRAAAEHHLPLSSPGS